MPDLIYSTITSLDGYIADTDGGIDWSEPDEEVHAFINEFEQSVGTYLYGRRMYETMLYWEAAYALTPQPTAARDFAALWQAADKIVYSRTLQATASGHTRIERRLDVGAVRKLKASAASNITVAGAELAAHALHAGLVDELHLFVVPLIVGGGKLALPLGLRLTLDLQDERRFDSGVVHLRYRITGP